MKEIASKRLLMCVPFVPYPPKSGGKIRVYQALRYLSRYYRISLIALQDPLQEVDDVKPLRSFCEEMYILRGPKFLPFKLHHFRDFFSKMPGSLVVHSSALVKKAKELGERGRFDVLQMEFSPLAHYASILPGKCKAITFHYLAEEGYKGLVNQLKPGFRRWYFERERIKAKSYELKLLSMYDQAFVTSEKHRLILKRGNKMIPIEVIPNGVDTKFFSPQPRLEKKPVFLFIGSLHITAANVESLELALNYVFPRVKRQLPNAVLRVIGRGLPESVKRAHSSLDIEFLGEVDDVRPHLADSTAVLLPMRSGSGTKLRIPTAMAMGRVVITTEEGLAGFECEKGKHLLVENDLNRMADQAVRLSIDNEWREEIEHESRRFVEQEYDWERIFERQVELYESIGCGKGIWK